MMDDWIYVVDFELPEEKVQTSIILKDVSKNIEEILGGHFDLEMLQEINKVRLEINTPMEKSNGRIKLFSNLNLTETVILVAALENVTGIGPKRRRIRPLTTGDAKSKITRRKVVERAKEILSSDLIGPAPTSSALKREVLQSLKRGGGWSY
ncbi:MAG: hypothetical protein ACE5HY_05100 [Candidatus Hydrothermarchaeales archaeon]